jgi:hypothetical protein
MTKLTKAALQRKKAAEDELLIPADNEQRRQYESARLEIVTRTEALRFAKISGEEMAETTAALKLDSARIALEQVKDEIRAKGTAITLRAVGRVRWDELRTEHAATEEMRAADAEKPEEERRTFNPETFWPAVLAETADSDLKPEDWDRLVLKSREWTEQEIDELKSRAALINQTSRIVALGN